MSLFTSRLQRAFAPLLAAAGLACSLPTALAAEGPEMVFARLGSNDGLSQGGVMAIVQDGQGFMWFGTEDGLDRFDGYELRHFIRKRGDATSLPSNWIAALARDAAGRIWIGTDGGGLAWRDADHGEFQAAVSADGQPLMEPDVRIRAMHVDHSGRIWVATRGAGLRMLDLAGRKTRQFRRDLTNPDSLSDDSVFAVAEDASGQIWVATETGLDRLDPDSGHIERFGARLRAAGAPKDRPLKVNTVYTDARGSVWAGLDSGLARFDEPAASFKLLQHRDTDPNSIPNGRVTALLEDDEQRLWVGTSSGLALLDRRTEKFFVVHHDPSNPASLPDNYVISLYQDRTGQLWIGTKTGGLARWNPRSWSFGHHRFGEDGADNVTAFAVDQRGTVWIGSFGAGVASIDPQSGETRRYSRAATSRPALHDDNVMALVTDERNRVWIGTMGAGVDRLDPATGEIKHFEHRPDDAATLPAPGVMSLLRDARGRIWVGTYGGGVARIDPATDHITRYAHGADATNGLPADRATALVEDRTGLIWIGTDVAGLSVLDPASGRFAHFAHDAQDPASISSNTIYSLHLDNKGVIWVGTRGGGLDRVVGAPFAKDRMRFENWSESDGLPNSTVYGIESDAAGTLWVSTNRGVAALRPQDRSVRSFRRSHGLQGDEFNFGAHARAPDGTLYFGGVNGYNAFLPERLQFNDKPPQIVLIDVLKLNTRATRTPELLRQLRLGHRDAAITFKFAALDFTGPAENRYAYRLEGFDTDWIAADGTRQASYTNLASGSYVFRVRAANSDGRWSDAPLSLPVQVAPPPWATWWARTLYVAALLIFVYWLWLSHHRRVQREAAYASRLRQEVDARTAELSERNAQMERVNRQLQEASISDSLTGLGNRRCLHEKMSALFKGRSNSAADAPLPRCVLIIVDLDHLKPINDQHGHEGGDAVLVQVAEILRRVFRSGDLIVRWGGDEFVVVCHDADLAAASVLAERVRSSVAKQLFRVGEGKVVRTSCSLGFAPVPFIPGHPQLLGWEQSLSIADLAMYEAKRERNTWVGWGGTDKAAELPSLLADLGADPKVLEQDGYLVARRRPWNPEETVDQLRAPRSPAGQ